MSDFAHTLQGNVTPWLMRYQVDATVANVGVPLLIDTAGEAGLNAGTTTSAADFVGMSQDTVTYTTTQGTGVNSAERKVGVNITPDAVWRALLSGGATEGTALTQHTVTTASAGGTAVTTGTAWNSPTYDEGVVWGYSGNNAGQVRKITSVSATAGTVTIPFDNAVAVGDVYLRAPAWFNATTTLQLTTNLFQVDASIAVATGAEYGVDDMRLLDIGGEGTLRSEVFFHALDHNKAARPT
jgi:hypothetical protein